MDSYIKDYEQKLKNQELFKCYYIDDHNLLIPCIKYSTSDVVHSMLWPSVFFVLCVICGLMLLYDPCGIVYPKYKASKTRTEDVEKPRRIWEKRKPKRIKLSPLPRLHTNEETSGSLNKKDNEREGGGCTVHELNETPGRLTYI